MSWQPSVATAPPEQTPRADGQVQDPAFDWIFQSTLDPRHTYELEQAISALHTSNTTSPSALGSVSTPSPAVEAPFTQPFSSPQMVEPSYDLFSTAPNTFGSRYRSDSAASSDGFDRTPHMQAASTDYMHQPPRSAAMGFSPNARQPNQYELMTAMNAYRSAPLTPTDRHAPAPFGFADTVSPNAVNKVSEAFAPEPSFAELMMDRSDDFSSPTGYHSRFPRYVDASAASSASSSRLASPAGQMRMHPIHKQETTYEHPVPFGSQADMAFRMPISSVDNNFSRPMHRLAYPDSSSGADLQSFVRPYLDQYINSPNRLAAGDRTIIVMSSKVAQKSYGTEKRFLCPPPTAVLIGNSWWSEARRGDEMKLTSPHVTVSISGEPIPSEGQIEWATASGRPIDAADVPSDDTTHIGRCVGKQLFISDADERKKKVEALVKVTAPVGDGEPDRLIGTFPSRPIKVISKPSKKRQSAKNLELCINHGSTISLFHRLRSQTVSTKYLCVSGSGASFKGSDGAPLPGLDARHRAATPSFVARTGSWDMFIIYIVDVNKRPGATDGVHPHPPHPEYPPPPPSAIPLSTSGQHIPVYYNQTVVLQCLISGVISPVLIIRKVDHGTVVVGGGIQDGAKGVPDHYCAPGEVCGDPVSQLHKIALEVYDPQKHVLEPGSPGQSGAFLSCMGEKVNTYRPVDTRQWNSYSATSSASHSPVMPSSPVVSTPTSANGSIPVDYFANSSNQSSPTATQFDYSSSDGGRVKRKRGSLSGATASAAMAKAKGRRRGNSSGSSSPRLPSGDHSMSSGALWSVDIGETAVWTVVGTDQVRYNFYVPPVLFEPPSAGPSIAPHIPSKPITPFPSVVKYLPPDRAVEVPRANGATSRVVITHPNPLASQLLTIYGENFSKTDPFTVFFGSDPSPHVEVRCSEVLVCLPPENAHRPTGEKRPIVLVRGDGVVFPSNVMYP